MVHHITGSDEYIMVFDVAMEPFTYT